jgi:imidazolonepropionase-like amidohydrolase
MTAARRNGGWVRTGRGAGNRGDRGVGRHLPFRAAVPLATITTLAFSACHPALGPGAAAKLGTQGVAAPAVALVGGTLLNPEQAPVRDAVIVVREGRVVCAGARAACPVPRSIEVVDVRGAFVAPGFIDAHAHYAQSGWVDSRPDAMDLRPHLSHDSAAAVMERQPERFDRAFLCAGVTSVLDAGGYTWTLSLTRTREGPVVAPRVAAAGPIFLTRESRLNHYLNFPTLPMFVVMTNDSVVRAAVRTTAAMGARAIKIGYLAAADSVRALALIAAAAEEAEAAGLPLIVHVQHLAGTKQVLRAGARVLVHVVTPEEIDEELIGLLRESGAIVVPTLTVFEGYGDLYAGRSPADRYPLDCVEPGMRAQLESPLPHALRAPRLSSVAVYDTLAAVGIRNVRRLHEAGIPIAVGTDAGNPGTAHGPSIYREMELLHAAGMTAADVFAAATIGGARALGRAHELGSLEPTKLADAVIFDADPTVDVRNARRVRMVMKGGALYSRAELIRRP